MSQPPSVKVKEEGVFANQGMDPLTSSTLKVLIAWFPRLLYTRGG